MIGTNAFQTARGAFSRCSRHVSGIQHGVPMDYMARLIKWVVPVVLSTGAASSSSLRSSQYCPHTTRTVTWPADIQ
eukprot:12885805-Prorocentrum_lima.AAC.1